MIGIWDRACPGAHALGLVSDIEETRRLAEFAWCS